ncbi:MAG: hypothetical protein HUK14_06235 [Muribaculaceae bacterium]|nr:hypothetical protein [Muribaculaceae bacterium]
MKLSRILAANIIILIAVLPCLLIFNESQALWLNIVGLGYAALLYRYGSKIAPKVVTDYLAYMAKKAEEWDTPIE